ncbi:MAG: hypothetical protein WC144_04225 [Sulfurimonas sp.]|jgi:hypothetical protein|nr:hypothetical protein [Sulfurimonadaceae bacterium]
MKEILKRYSVAFAILLFVAFLMLLGTFGVTKFGQSLFDEAGIEIKPQGENILK